MTRRRIKAKPQVSNTRTESVLISDIRVWQYSLLHSTYENLECLRRSCVRQLCARNWLWKQTTERLDVVDIEQTQTAVRGGDFRDSLTTRMCDNHYSNWFINRPMNALVWRNATPRHPDKIQVRCTPSKSYGLKK